MDGGRLWRTRLILLLFFSMVLLRELLREVMT